MFFSLSKLLWPLLAPLNLLLILFTAALALYSINKRAGTFVLITTFTGFLLGGFFPLGHNAIVLLENAYSRPVELPDQIAGIIVLGGALDTHISTIRNVPAVNGNVERVTEAVYLESLYPSAIILFTGGEGRLQPSGTTEGELIRSLLQRQGIELENVLYEEDSRNTHENALFSRNLLEPQPDEKWILVTSAFHMRRAMAVFEKAGWQNLIPWVVDYRTSGKLVAVPNLNALDNFTYLHMAVREHIGHLIYNLTDKI